LIYCSGNSSTTCTTKSFSDGNCYLDSSNSLNVIHCNSTVCISSPGKSSVGYAYIDSSQSSLKYLITCSEDENGCQSKNSCSEGVTSYFIDDGNFNNIITCTSNCVYSESGATTSQNFNSIILSLLILQKNYLY